jgi:hypothetical protein
MYEVVELYLHSTIRLHVVVHKDNFTCYGCVRICLIYVCFLPPLFIYSFLFVLFVIRLYLSFFLSQFGPLFCLVLPIFHNSSFYSWFSVPYIPFDFVFHSCFRYLFFIYSFFPCMSIFLLTFLSFIPSSLLTPPPAMQ